MLYLLGSSGTAAGKSSLGTVVDSKLRASSDEAWWEDNSWWVAPSDPKPKVVALFDPVELTNKPDASTELDSPSELEADLDSVPVNVRSWSD